MAKFALQTCTDQVIVTQDKKIKPKYLNVTIDFEPRGNVHTIIEVDSIKLSK